MGILNTTPDSFSDGGAYRAVGDAVAAGLAMAAEGADIVDVGGESTQPGAPDVPPAIEQARILPVVRELARQGVLISVDTRNASTMAAALDAGATIVNDVSALVHDPAAAPLVARRGCPVVLMHMRGGPTTMQARAVYSDVVAEVATELRARLADAEHAGIRRDAIAIDPGVGFAKDAAQSVAILRGLPGLAALGCPLLVGVSRKSFIGAVGRVPDAQGRLPGSLAAALFALSRGASILRVHDVAATVQAIRVWTALAGAADQPA